VKSGITEAVISWAKFKAQSQLDKVGGKKKSKLKGVAKLEDANEAGSKNAHRCTLILTEGDSAKTLAVSGLGVVGRDHYGVFPLRGKLLNVREASHKQVGKLYLTPEFFINGRRNFLDPRECGNQQHDQNPGAAVQEKVQLSRGYENPEIRKAHDHD
jgi:hypothetical protein